VEEKNIYDESDYIDIQNKLHNKNVDSLIESMYTKKNNFYELNDFKKRINQGIKQQLVNNEYKIPNKTLYKIGNCDNNKNCIVCCTAFKHGNNDSRFVSSNNIIKSLTEVGYNGHFYLFNGGFPNPTGKEMKYAGVPYCFKIFMMLFCKKNLKKNSSGKIVKNKIFINHKQVMLKLGNFGSKTKNFPIIPIPITTRLKGKNILPVCKKIFL
jgi:hypothetical protein